MEKCTITVLIKSKEERWWQLPQGCRAAWDQAGCKAANWTFRKLPAGGSCRVAADSQHLLSCLRVSEHKGALYQALVVLVIVIANGIILITGALILHSYHTSFSLCIGIWAHKQTCIADIERSWTQRAHVTRWGYSAVCQAILLSGKRAKTRIQASWIVLKRILQGLISTLCQFKHTTEKAHLQKLPMPHLEISNTAFHPD